MTLMLLRKAASLLSWLRTSLARAGGKCSLLFKSLSLRMRAASCTRRGETGQSSCVLPPPPEEEEEEEGREEREGGGGWD